MSAQKPSERDYDIAIVGGGMVGASLAVALAGSGYRCALIESGSFDQGPPASFDERAIALSRGSTLFLDRLGLWRELSAEAADIRQVHVSEHRGIGVVRLDAARNGVPALGHVIPASSLGRVFVDRLPRLESVDLFTKARLTQISPTPDFIRLGLDGADLPRLNARLLVAADGVGSFVRKGLGIGVDEVDYGHTAVVFNLASTCAAEGVAFERFTTRGPLALLPLSGDRWGVVWTISTKDRAEVESWSDERVMQEIHHLIGYRAGRFERMGKRVYYPLKRVRSLEQVRPRVCVIGNAAHSLHPIGGQGFNLGLRDVMLLAQLLDGAGEDPGQAALTRAYERGRTRDQDAVSGFTHGLARVFSVPGLPARCARGLGLLAVESMPPLKRWLADRAMGVSGPVPGSQP